MIYYKILQKFRWEEVCFELLWVAMQSLHFGISFFWTSEWRCQGHLRATLERSSLFWAALMQSPVMDHTLNNGTRPKLYWIVTDSEHCTGLWPSLPCNRFWFTFSHGTRLWQMLILSEYVCRRRCRWCLVTFREATVGLVSLLPRGDVDC